MLEAPFTMIVLILGNLYPSNINKFRVSLGQIIKPVIAVAAVLIVVSFFAKLFPYSRAVFSLYFILLIPGLWLPRLLVLALVRVFCRRPQSMRTVLIIDNPKNDDESSEHFELPPSPYLNYKHLILDENNNIDIILNQIDQGSIECVVLHLPFSDVGLVAQIADKAETEGINIYLSPRTFPVSFLHPSSEMFLDTPLIALKAPSLSDFNKITKRLIDILLSFVGLVILLPLFIFIGIAIKLTSKGPIFYNQTRVGIGGRKFTMHKFRSMKIDAEDVSGPVWAKTADSRCTSLGKWLRRTNLDEFPQLINVFWGSMSLVGPRPERPEFIGEFKKNIDRYAHKHWVKPGITGWAQINGWRGRTSLEERIRHDLWYIENWSLMLDFKILLLTPIYIKNSQSAS